MKPTFKSKDFLFREPTLGSALKAAGLVKPMALVREGVLEVFPKKGKPYVVTRRTRGAFGHDKQEKAA